MLLRKRLRIRPWESAWTLPSRLQVNPMGGLVSIEEILIVLHFAPRELPAAGLERGLIPWIPADREDG